MKNKNDESESLDLLLAGFSVDVKEENEETWHDRIPVTFWLPQGYEAKYKAVQNKTKRKFHKLVKELIKKAIDRKYAEIA